MRLRGLSSQPYKDIYDLGSGKMRSEKELFKLAQMYVGLEEQFNRASPYELDEIKYELAKIRDILLKKRYDVDEFVHYQQLYKTMTIKEYSEFIKTLE